MNSSFDSTNAATPSNTIASIFATQHDARDAIKDLHKAGFKTTWLGMTQPPDRDTGAAMVEDPGGLARFIGGGDRMPLHKALVAHGVVEAQAERIEREIAPGCAIVTVYGEDNPSKAEELLEAHMGHVVGATTAMPTAVEIASMSPRTGVQKDELKLAEREREVKDPKADDLGRGGIEPDDDADTEAFGDTFIERRYQGRL